MNGSLSVSWSEHITIRATQKKRMSCPVSSSVVGCHACRSAAFSSGHPSVENGKRPEENHVSRTSSSCTTDTSDGAHLCASAAIATAASADAATTGGLSTPFTLT